MDDFEEDRRQKRENWMQTLIREYPYIMFFIMVGLMFKACSS